MNVVIIEREESMAGEIAALLNKLEPSISIVAGLTTVGESVSFFKKNKIVIDLIFSEVHLADGIAFSIFQTVSASIPIVFITAFDEFVPDALTHNCIDYILKPVTGVDVKRALDKYKKLRKHFLHHGAVNHFMEYLNDQKKSRLIVKWGTENVALPIHDIALLYTKNKVVYAIDKNSKKYIIDKTMRELEMELDKKTFFRANRQYIVSINYIKGFRSYERVKLELELTLADFNDLIIVSQDTAPLFKAWIALA